MARRLRFRRRELATDDTLPVGAQEIVEISKGSRTLYVELTRGRFGWTAWLVNAEGKHGGPISMSNYKGASLDQAVALAEKFIAGVHTKRN